MKRASWLVGGLIGLVTVALIVAVLVRATGSDKVETVASSRTAGSGQSGSRSPGGVASTAVTVVPAVTTTLGQGSQSVAARAPSADGPATSGPRTSTTSVDTTTSSTTLPGGPPGPACEPSMFEAKATVDKPSYGQGKPVKATATFTNTSGQTCYWISTSETWDVLDQFGFRLTVTPFIVGDPFRWVPFGPGETSTQSATWDQQVCRDRPACEPASKGRYTFVLTRQPFGTARVSFTVNASG